MHSNYNRIRRIDNLIIKTFESQERFDSEIKYNGVFKNLGFRVPEIISSNTKELEVVTKFICGASKTTLSSKDIDRCLKELAKIYTIWSSRIEGNEIKKKYLSSLKQNISLYADSKGLVVNQIVLDDEIDRVSNYFRPSLFKDAKPANWIFNKDGVWMIDFDYVRPSYYLADVMQLLNYQNLNFHSEYIYVKRFHELIKLSPPKVSVAALVGVNSKIMSMRYNKNLNTSYRDSFAVSIKNTLEEMGIV